MPVRRRKIESEDNKTLDLTREAMVRSRERRSEVQFTKSGINLRDLGLGLGFLSEVLGTGMVQLGRGLGGRVSAEREVGIYNELGTGRIFNLWAFCKLIL